MPARLSILAPIALALVLGACNTPSVPIPPPKTENMEFQLDEQAGTARFAYDADDDVYAFAVVYVFNRTVGRGVIDTANADGSVDPTDPFPARVGDEIVVSFETEEELVSTCVQLEEAGAGDPCDF